MRSAPPTQLPRADEDLVRAFRAGDEARWSSGVAAADRGQPGGGRAAPPATGAPGEAGIEDARGVLVRDAACAALERLELRGVIDALAALPPRQRRALAGHAFQSLPYAELAEDAGTTPRAVKGLVHRARQTVRETLAEAA